MNICKNKKIAQLLLGSGFILSTLSIPSGSTLAAKEHGGPPAQNAIRIIAPQQALSSEYFPISDINSLNSTMHNFYSHARSVITRKPKRINFRGVNITLSRGGACCAKDNPLGPAQITAMMIVESKEQGEQIITDLRNAHQSYQQPWIIGRVLKELKIECRLNTKNKPVKAPEINDRRKPEPMPEGGIPSVNDEGLESKSGRGSSPEQSDDDAKSIISGSYADIGSLFASSESLASDGWSIDSELNNSPTPSIAGSELNPETSNSNKSEPPQCSNDQKETSNSGSSEGSSTNSLKLTDGNTSKTDCRKSKFTIAQNNDDEAKLPKSDVSGYESTGETKDEVDVTDAFINKQSMHRELLLAQQRFDNIEYYDESKTKENKQNVLKELLRTTEKIESDEFEQGCADGGEPNPKPTPSPAPDSTTLKSTIDKDKAGRMIEDGSLSIVQRDIGLMLDEREDMSFAAMAAGDERALNDKAIWLRGIYASNRQAQAKGNVAAGSIGFDFETDNNLLLGAAYSRAKTRYKYRDGDRTNVGSNIFSVYVQKEKGNILLRGIISYSAGRVTSKDTIKATGDIVTGSFKTHSYAASALLGHKIHGCGFEIMPFIGASYASSVNGAYTESGHLNPANNLRYGKSSSNEFTAKLGIRASKPTRLESGALLVPHISISAQRDFKNNLHSVSAWLDSGERVDFSDTRSAGIFKKSKFAYNAGAGLTYRKNNVELSAEYIGQFRHSYKTRQGSLKIKIFI